MDMNLIWKDIIVPWLLQWVEQFLGHETFSDFKINSDESLEINISDFKI